MASFDPLTCQKPIACPSSWLTTCGPISRHGLWANRNHDGAEACPPFVAVTRPLMVAVVGAGGVGVTTGAGVGVGMVGVELPQVAANRVRRATRARFIRNPL
jgi:hypothetical protein